VFRKIITFIFFNISTIIFKDDLHYIINTINNISYNENHARIKVLVLAEDKRFFSHCGFDIFAILRATFYYILRKRISGASTIDQQLIRTITNDRRFTLSRKAKEIILSVSINKEFSKHKIASTYIYLAYYGWKMNGVYQATNRLKEYESLCKMTDYSLIALLKYPLPKNPSARRMELIQSRIEFIKEKLEDNKWS
jgi:penicillin-binding protein 1A